MGDSPPAFPESLEILEVFFPPPTASTSIKVDVGICASAFFVTAEVAVLD